MTQPAAPLGKRLFVLKRLGSILAVLPLGVWTIFHLWENLAVFAGPAAWQSAVTDHGHPVSTAAVWIIVFVPLLWHTVWGIGRLFTSRPNTLHYGYLANLRYLLQRLAAVGLLAFLIAHVWLAMLQPRLLEGRPEPFAEIAREVRFHTPTLLVYVLGILATAYHLANGLATFAMGFGIALRRRSLKRLENAAIGLFVLLLGLGWAAIYGLWKAGDAGGP